MGRGDRLLGPEPVDQLSDGTTAYMTPSHPPAEADAPPATIWQAIRFDLVVFALATGGLVVNLVSPDSLSPALMVLFGLAMGWIGYRMFRKIQLVRART